MQASGFGCWAAIVKGPTLSNILVIRTLRDGDLMREFILVNGLAEF